MCVVYAVLGEVYVCGQRVASQRHFDFARGRHPGARLAVMGARDVGLPVYLCDMAEHHMTVGDVPQPSAAFA